jgi:hypothetical protein
VNKGSKMVHFILYKKVIIFIGSLSQNLNLKKVITCNQSKRRKKQKMEKGHGS